MALFVPRMKGVHALRCCTPFCQVSDSVDPLRDTSMIRYANMGLGIDKSDTVRLTCHWLAVPDRLVIGW